MLAVLLTAFHLASAPAAPADIGPDISAEAARADLALAREALSRIHPGYDRYTSAETLDAAWALAEHRADGDVDRLYLDLSRILAEIRCDHTKAELPQAAAEARETAPVYLPFRFRIFGAAPEDWRMVVDHPGQTGLVRGEEILTIDGDAAGERLRAVAAFMPVDGFTDHVKPLVIAGTTEFLGSGFDHFDPMLNAFTQTVDLTVRGLDGEVRQVRARRIGYESFREIGADGRRFRNFSDPDMSGVDFPAPGVAVMRVDTFVNYRTPVEPEEVYGPLFDAVAEAGVETLIIDLRRNGGGSGDAQFGLLRRLLLEPAEPVRDVRVRSIDLTGLREHMNTWIPQALDPQPEYFNARSDGWWSVKPAFGGAQGVVEPHPEAFQGEVILLTSRANSSGSTSFTAALRETDRATLVGEPTGGSQEGPTAGVIYFLTLPNSGIVVRVPWQFTEQGVTDPVYGRGFDPDVRAPLTYEAWMDGQDPALEAAIALATER